MLGEGEARRSRGMLTAQVCVEPALRACSAHFERGASGEMIIKTDNADVSAVILL